MNPILIALLGSLVGFSLGLTGGGGAIFAVPLLVYALGVGTQEAVFISLITVGFTALIGFLSRLRIGQVEFATGIVFAVAGMFGAPIGSYLAMYIPDSVLIVAFAILMLTVAWKMWSKANRFQSQLSVLPNQREESTCRRDGTGQLKVTSPCAMLLGIVGLLAGVLTGMFGVGGGFILVPALVGFASMEFKKAVGTSLLIITLVSVSGISAKWIQGQGAAWPITSIFTLGSIGGLFLGTMLAKRLSGPVLQKTFALAIVATAIFVISRSFISN